MKLNKLVHSVWLQTKTRKSRKEMKHSMRLPSLKKLLWRLVTCWHSVSEKLVLRLLQPTLVQVVTSTLWCLVKEFGLSSVSVTFVISPTLPRFFRLRSWCSSIRLQRSLTLKLTSMADQQIRTLVMLSCWFGNSRTKMNSKKTNQSQLPTSNALI